MNPNEEFLRFVETSTFPLVFSAKIIPHAPKTEVKGQMDDGTWKISVSAPPEDGKANTELLSFLKKITGKRAELLAGETNRKKKLQIAGSEE